MKIGSQFQAPDEVKQNDESNREGQIHFNRQHPWILKPNAWTAGRKINYSDESPGSSFVSGYEQGVINLAQCQ